MENSRDPRLRVRIRKVIPGEDQVWRKDETWLRTEDSKALQDTFLTLEILGTEDCFQAVCLLLCGCVNAGAVPLKCRTFFRNKIHRRSNCKRKDDPAERIAKPSVTAKEPSPSLNCICGGRIGYILLDSWADHP